MSRRVIPALAIVALVLLAGATVTGLFGARGDRRAPREAPPRATAPAPPPPAPGAVPAEAGRVTGLERTGFRSETHLREHHDKHGREFGTVSRQEYLALAQALRDRPLGPRVIEATRADGVVTRFDRDSGAFIAFDPDGTIRTFLRPRDGEAYFRRQRDRPAR
ncbi:MAG: hypothetical protein ABW020_04610 [Candidatus Rokuibacteriota bacterium]